MSHDQNVRTLRDGIIVLQDGNSTNQQSLTLDVEEGDLKFTVDRTARIIMDRGALHRRRTGDQVACKISFSAKLCKYESESGEDPSVADCLQQNGEASGWTSTSTAGEPFTVDLVFKMANPDSSGNREVLTFADFHADTIDVEEGDENKVSIEGTALVVQPTASFEAQS